MMSKTAIANEFCHECYAKMDIAHPYPDHWIEKGGKPADARICHSCHETFKNTPVGSMITVRQILGAGLGFVIVILIFGYLPSILQNFGHT